MEAIEHRWMKQDMVGQLGKRGFYLEVQRLEVATLNGVWRAEAYPDLSVMKKRAGPEKKLAHDRNAS
jgi:hypothetical protein